MTKSHGARGARRLATKLEQIQLKGDRHEQEMAGLTPRLGRPAIARRCPMSPMSDSEVRPGGNIAPSALPGLSRTGRP